MDLLSIEAMSVAIRAGQVAAGETFTLLTTDTDFPGRIEDWFDPQPWPEVNFEQTQRLVAIGYLVEKLGAYVCSSADPVGGERLFRWSVIEHLIGRAEWSDLVFGRRQAFEIFALVSRAAYLPLRSEQQRLMAEGADPPKQLGLALEDSIFEPDEPLSTLRPEAVAAAPLMAAYAAREPAREAERKRRKEKAEPTLAEVRAATDSLERAFPGKPLPAAPAPISIGEAPARPAVNRGGRGNKKPK